MKQYKNPSLFSRTAGPAVPSLVDPVYPNKGAWPARPFCKLCTTERRWPLCKFTARKCAGQKKAAGGFVLTSWMSSEPSLPAFRGGRRGGSLLQADWVFVVELLLREGCSLRHFERHTFYFINLTCHVSLLGVQQTLYWWWQRGRRPWFITTKCQAALKSIKGQLYPSTCTPFISQFIAAPN